MAVLARPYAGPADLRRMQRLVQDVWAAPGAPSVWHVGDLAWQRFQHVGREPLWRTQLWEQGETTVAYGWLFENGVLGFCVHPSRPELLDEVLDWAEAREADVLETDEHAVTTLEHHGYRRAGDDRLFFVRLARDLDEPAVPEIPDGFVLRTVGEDDVPGRVEAHRSAFHPSSVTVESYRNVMRAWPYRRDLDCIAVAADGRVTAYCLAWLDDENRVGELEPVGTHADFTRRGLASAVCAFALRRLREKGAERAVVYARGDAAYPGPLLLYESIGFRTEARTLTFRRPA